MRLPSYLRVPPPVIAPHVRQQPVPPPVQIGDPPQELSPTDKAARVATELYYDALKRGKSKSQAASIARSQALNFLFRIGIFKPQADRHEY